MDKKLTNVLIFLGVILVFFAVVMFVIGKGEAKEGALLNFSVDQATVVLRFVFVIIGLLIAFAAYYFTKENAEWEVGTRQVVWMAIGAALYAGFSWLFNGTVFVVSFLSQVALLLARAILLLFGNAFWPVLGSFFGKIGNRLGLALT